MDCARDNYNGSVQRMAEKWGKSVKGKANLARATQLRFFKVVWLQNSSPHALVMNVISTDLDIKEAPMKVHPDIVKTGVKTVDELRTCLKSEEMYLNPAIYNLMCCGLESGKLKNAKKGNDRKINYSNEKPNCGYNFTSHNKIAWQKRRSTIRF